MLHIIISIDKLKSSCIFDHTKTTKDMKTNITPELKARIAKSAEAHKTLSANLAELIAKGDYVYAKPYVSKPNPTPGYQNMPSFKAKINAFAKSLNR